MQYTFVRSLVNNEIRVFKPNNNKLILRVRWRTQSIGICMNSDAIISKKRHFLKVTEIVSLACRNFDDNLQLYW